MPIYAYACKHCEHTLDALQKIADPPLVECPACGEPALKRLLSAPRFRLKGSGWYETDFKKDNQRNLAGEREPGKKEGKEGKADGDKPGSGKSDKADSAARPDKADKPGKAGGEAKPAAASGPKPA